MKDWTIHIGFPKCGSTWLQMRVFPRLSDVDFVGKVYAVSEWNDALRSLCQLSAFDYPEGPIIEQVRQWEKEQQRPFQLASWEDFAGNTLQLWNDPRRTAERLQRLFPEARILINVRRQESLIESFYKQYLQYGGTVSFETFLTGSNPLHRMDFETLRFDRLVRCYEDVFGPGKIEVVPFEMMGQDQQRFADVLSDLIGCERVTLQKEEKAYVRKGYSPRYCGIVRLLNLFSRTMFQPVGLMERPSSKATLGFRSPYHLGRRVSDFLDRFDESASLVTPEQRQRIHGYFAECNAALTAQSPRLAEFGYGPQFQTSSSAIPNVRIT